MLKTIIILLSLVTAVPAMAAPARKVALDRDGWPQTRKGEIAREWVRAFASGDSAMRGYYTRYLAPTALVQKPLGIRIERYHDLRDKLGKLTLASLGDSTASNLNVKLVAEDASTHDLTFTIETSPPYSLLTISMKEFRPHFGFMHH